MEILRQWIISVSFAAIAGALIYLLAPKGSTERAVRTVVAVFLIASVAAPLTGLKENKVNLSGAGTPVLQQNASALEDLLLQQANETTQDTLQGILKAYLEQRGLSAGQILLKTDILDNGRIEIREVKIKLDGTARVTAGELEEAILTQTGLTVKVVIL